MNKEQAGVLGFIPQKENVFNKLLPYADKLDIESNDLLAKIKDNLGRAVQLRELWPGVVFWTKKLTRYLHLYGRKFSKEDHVLFIKLYFELVTIPKLEISMMQTFAQILTNLLEKKWVLSRDDLELPWRPLYDLYESTVYSKTEPLGVKRFQAEASTRQKKIFTARQRLVRTVLNTLIKSCRVYFPVSATQEMLDEWRPLLCPFDASMHKAISYFQLFLPTLMPPEQHERGFKLWFDELMNLWVSLQALPAWEGCLVNLFARLAHDTIGFVDWSPYIPKIFTRALRSFNLPLVTSQIMAPMYFIKLKDIGKVVLWISSMLGGPQNLAQKQLNGLFSSIASFYHPSNNGPWLTKLMKFIQCLPGSVVHRLYRERQQKPNWMPPVPTSHKLTDQDVTDFVESMKQPVLMAMFSKTGCMDAAQALHQLAMMRPELVIPPVLEKTYAALETLTEPHQLTATLSCMIGMTRSLLGDQQYPEGLPHVLPLLMRALPGIDPNDFRKCMITFQFIAALTSLVPLVDCSSALHDKNDLTEMERELCSASAEFEDFVLQFMDRCFALIDSSTLQQTRAETETELMTHVESQVELRLSTTFSIILTQCSMEIFKVALAKLFNFATTNIFETHVAGMMVADMCRVASKCHPTESLRLFVPYCCSAITRLTANEDVLNEVELDKELLWNLQLLSEVTRVDGEKLLPYQTQLVQTLQVTLCLRCKLGYVLASYLLYYVLSSTALIYATDYCSVPGGFSSLPIKDWGRLEDITSVQIQWHVPSPEETIFVFNMLDLFLWPELQKLQSYAQGEQPMSRDDILQSMCIVQHCLLGAGSMLPPLDGSKVTGFVPSSVSLEETKIYFGVDYDETRENYRETICRVMRQLLNYILEHSEDDTMSLMAIIKIIGTLMHFKGFHKHHFESHSKTFSVAQKSMKNILSGKKRSLRSLCIDRIVIQHEERMSLVDDCEYKSVHQDLLRDLLRLSTSTYSQVRKQAQHALFTAIGNYSFCCRDITPLVLEFLEPTRKDVTQQQFKGALYCLLGNHRGISLAFLRDWVCIAQTWPAIVRSGLNSAMSLEKPSMVRLFDGLVDKVHHCYETIGIDFTVPEGAVALGKSITSSSHPTPYKGTPTDQEMLQGLTLQQDRNREAEQKYDKLVSDLLACLDHRDLPRKFGYIAVSFMFLLLREDHPLPVPAALFVVKNLNHEAFIVRKMSIAAVGGILKQLKRPQKKITVNPCDMSGVTEPEGTAVGDRPGNEWLQYHSDSLPKDEQAWNSFCFVEKSYLGYSCWPKEFIVYAPIPEQPKDLSPEIMNERERIIYDHFTDPVFVSQLFKSLSIEDRPGKDRFSSLRFHLFKGLFLNYTDAFLPVLKPHIERLVNYPKESTHHFVAEIIAGLIRGSKHWSFDKVEALWAFVIPLMRTALSKLNVETFKDWGYCVSLICVRRDPRKVYWLLEMLMECPLSGEGGSFVDSCRLLILQKALSHYTWRVPELLHRLLSYLEPKLTQVYKTVRDRIGCVLEDIFMFDVCLPNTLPTKSPHTAEFLDRTLTRLKTLLAGGKDIHVMEEDGVGVQDKRAQAIKLLITVLKWLMLSSVDYLCTPVLQQLEILPQLFKIATIDNNCDELKMDASSCLWLFSQGLLYPNQIPLVLKILHEVAGCIYWHARFSVLPYLQSVVFYNLSIIQSMEQSVEDVRALVLRLLEDEQLEVREMAAKTLSGFLQCNFLAINTSMLNHFEALCKTKLPKRRRDLGSVKDPIPSVDLVKRHAGVLGLSACILSSPYNVPTWMPQLLMDLSAHLNDTLPIETTVKKTLADFRRTHHDNWLEHKQQFTDDQLVVLTNLLVSPCYYA